jgi:hypothetical protein
MSMPVANPLGAFQWLPQPEADRLLHHIVSQFLAQTPVAARLVERLRCETGTRFMDWIDHVVLPASAEFENTLVAVGFVAEPVGTQTAGARKYFVHKAGLFPFFILEEAEGQTKVATTRVAIKVESVADFLIAQGISAIIEGWPLSPYRRALVAASEETELWAVERHGYRGFDLPPFTPKRGTLRLRHLEAFRLRQRDFGDVPGGDALGFIHAEQLIDAAIADLGVDLACALFFAAEREYWQRRNHAAQVQKARQDRLGLGWANHDHHTYRSSREHFVRLIAVFEKLGFQCRERFFSGREAGWGAQILEQPNAGVVIFADVDLSADELVEDFAHEPLPPRRELGTVGLWCALHGESFLQAGMHHLECRFDFEALREQLETCTNIRVMKPFTDYPYLRQAFTEGEYWPVGEERLARLLAAGQITAEQAARFREQGAIGSHLENLERNDGFKGFNQKGVSEIIARTDPRWQLVNAP